jgi:hypothetical protein
MHAIVDFVRRCPSISAVSAGFRRGLHVSSADVYRGGADVLDPFAKVFARAVEGRLGEYEDSEVSSIVFTHLGVLTVQLDTPYRRDHRRFFRLRAQRGVEASCNPQRSVVSDCMPSGSVVDAGFGDEAGSIGCKDVVDCGWVAVYVRDGRVSCVEVISY